THFMHQFPFNLLCTNSHFACLLCTDPISSEFSFLVAFKSLTNLSGPSDSFNVMSVYNSAGEEQFGLRVYRDAVALTITVLQGPEATPKRVTVKFTDVSLNDRKWHRVAF